MIDLPLGTKVRLTFRYKFDKTKGDEVFTRHATLIQIYVSPPCWLAWEFENGERQVPNNLEVISTEVLP